jgi:Putative polyhydroxyalkanoic acid system protein (PHA_gran_rgn)
MKHEIPHDLDVALAKIVTAKAFESYRVRFAEYAPKLEWLDDRQARIEFRVKGLRLQGSIGIRPRSIDVDLDVPLVFRLFRNKAIEVIEREVRVWIGRAKAGQLTAASEPPH